MSPDSCDLNCLSYWFPKLEAAGVLVPRTKIVRMPKEAQEVAYGWLDGQPSPEVDERPMTEFLTELRAGAQEFGLPVFLRTGQGSGKHEWKHTCCVTDLDRLPRHVMRLIEWSEMADIIGLPWDTWVIREMLPVTPIAVCPAYGNMPVVREFRFFVSGGVPCCSHPYWPLDSLIEGLRRPDQGTQGAVVDLAKAVYAMLCRTDRMSEMSELARIAGQAVPGAWSVDILETNRGLVVTDMAEAKKSFHWPGCPHQGAFV